MNELLAVLASLLAGAAVAWWVRGIRTSVNAAVAASRLEAAEQKITEQQTALEAAHAELARAREARYAESERRAAAEQAAARIQQVEMLLNEHAGTITAQRATIAELETRIVEERKAATDKLGLLNDAQLRLADAFKALSSEALKSNNQAFIELAKATLEKFQEGARGDLEARKKAVDELVRPLRESMEKVDTKLGEMEKTRISAYSALSEQLKGLVETHLPQLHSETQNLVKALRQPTVRGRWGEIQLKRVVEMAGMVDHCDFVEQESVETEDGRRRPDLVVRLPGGKTIIVDAKAPVSAYLNAVEATDEDAQKAFLSEHARQVRDHMTALGRKSYWDQFDTTPEFAVLFLPGEMFFSAALQQDPELIEFGVNQRVIPATPTTLIALLRAVAYGWRQEALARNAQEVADLGKQLYERIAKLADHWSTVGQRLDQAVDAYNKTVATLESRVLVTARRLRDLKAGDADLEIGPIEPIERATRPVQGLPAPENDNRVTKRVVGVDDK
ncbi:MAG: DNA recombination protein RmuC [Gammaproteobacteria bacterium]|nr:DNA recombination protein RmuC [Gammaproteobacteria bacterium]